MAKLKTTKTKKQKKLLAKKRNKQTKAARKKEAISKQNYQNRLNNKRKSKSKDKSQIGDVHWSGNYKLTGKNTKKDSNSRMTVLVKKGKAGHKVARIASINKYNKEDVEKGKRIKIEKSKYSYLKNDSAIIPEHINELYSTKSEIKKGYPEKRKLNVNNKNDFSDKVMKVDKKTVQKVNKVQKKKKRI